MKADNQTTRNARGEISQAQARKLLEAAEFALHELNRMTTEKFSYGGDREIRIRLDAIIREIRKEQA